MKADRCFFCKTAPVYADHKQVRPDWLPEGLRVHDEVAVCLACHRLIIQERWTDLVVHVATVRDNATSRGYFTCSEEAANAVVRFLAYDAGEYDVRTEP